MLPLVHGRSATASGCRKPQQLSSARVDEADGL